MHTEKGVREYELEAEPYRDVHNSRYEPRNRTRAYRIARILCCRNTNRKRVALDATAIDTEAAARARGVNRILRTACNIMAEAVRSHARYTNVLGSGVIESRSIEQVRRSLSPRAHDTHAVTSGRPSRSPPPGRLPGRPKRDVSGQLVLATHRQLIIF